MHAVGKADDLGGSHRELTGLGAAGAALNTDDVTTAERCVQRGELTLVMVGLCEDLDFGAVTFEIDEDELFTSTTDGKDTASQGDGHIFSKLVVLSDGLIVLTTELIDAVRACELVRVWVHVLISQ